MQTIVILTGPVGTDLKLFKNLLTKNKNVATVDSNLWNDITQIRDYDWGKSQYYVTSITCPTLDDTIPTYFKFINEFQKLDFRVVIAIVGQNQKTLSKIQKKKLQRESTVEFQAEIDKLSSYGPLFISVELFDAYGKDYLMFLQNYLKIPIDMSAYAVAEVIEPIPVIDLW